MSRIDTLTEKEASDFHSYPSLWNITRLVLTLKKIQVLDTVSKVIVITFFLTFLHTVLKSEEDVNFTNQVILNIHTDGFPNETTWTLYIGNTYEVLLSSEDKNLLPYTFYSDTLLLDAQLCLTFEIEDQGADGFEDQGYFNIIINEQLVQDNENFYSKLNQSYNCGEGLVCNESIPLNNGSELLKKGPNSWFVIRPVFDTYYKIQTESSCDTKIWLYDICGKDHPTDQTGSILFNDFFEDGQAGFSSIKLLGGSEYFVRVGIDSECTVNSFLYITDLKLKEGCMDPKACNFDPLANLENGKCDYGDCHPDLAINRNELYSSILLDSIDNDSECLIREGCLQGYGKRDIIRFTTQIENLGNADYIVGEAEEESPLFSENNCHEHWHYLGYAEYLLFDAQGAPQPVGFKNGFCALDFRCKDENSYKYDCNYMGISAGCYDIYQHDLLCQWIDITNVADGFYTLVVRINYNQTPDLFGRVESDFQNNWAQVCINLDRSSGKLKLELLTSCPEFTDCMGDKFGKSEIDCNGICGGAAQYGDITSDGYVDHNDLSEYERILKESDANFSKCFDLNGDGNISIYDLSLLNDCIKHHTEQEPVSTHTHCDFPRSITNPLDSVFFRFVEYHQQENWILMEYRANTDISAVDLPIENTIIDSVVFLDPDMNLMSLSSDNRIIFYAKDVASFMPKNNDFVSLVKVYLSSDEQLGQGCFKEPFYIVNSHLALVNAEINENCLSFLTTATLDSEYLATIKLHPNPASEFIHLQIPPDFILKKWIIFDAFGKEIMHSNLQKKAHKPISVESIFTGYYFIQFESESGVFTSSFIKL